EKVGAAWNQTVKFAASDAAPGDLFGNSVAINGNRILIGARGSANLGAVYLYEQDAATPSQWNQLQKLVPPNGIADDHFGWSVALSQGRAVIGANYNLHS